MLKKYKFYSNLIRKDRDEYYLFQLHAHKDLICLKWDDRNLIDFVITSDYDLCEYRNTEEHIYEPVGKIALYKKKFFAYTKRIHAYA